MSLNLEKQLSFYGAYHHNPTNIVIHMTCIPILLATGLLLGTNSPTLIPLPSWLTIPNFPFNAGSIAAILYSGFYMLLEPVAGSMLLPVIIGWTAFSNHLTSGHAYTININAIVIHVGAWIAQFVGHGVYEGRAPALLDNLLQALVLAPFFVFMELLFKAGYRPELQKRVNAEVEKQIQKFRSDKGQKANGSVKNGKAN
ncbi:hypothetical protein BJ878DRAFT_520281 [Calycina marina]|uniref:DUF962-domain-containing protein n=1 Tax=Calycina marina TaxID=1763456 RepID=A0A9P7YXG3_9HELO|nr:hypothetical protein BJ878DRAFT_520281 [Calycina marina]